MTLRASRRQQFRGHFAQAPRAADDQRRAPANSPGSTSAARSCTTPAASAACERSSGSSPTRPPPATVMRTRRNRGSVADDPEARARPPGRLVASLDRQLAIDGMQPRTHHADQQGGGGERGDATRTEPAGRPPGTSRRSRRAGSRRPASLTFRPSPQTTDRAASAGAGTGSPEKRFRSRRRRAPKSTTSWAIVIPAAVKRRTERSPRSASPPRRPVSSTAAKCLKCAFRRRIGGSATSLRAPARRAPKATGGRHAPPARQPASGARGRRRGASDCDRRKRRRTASGRPR